MILDESQYLPVHFSLAQELAQSHFTVQSRRLACFKMSIPQHDLKHSQISKLHSLTLDLFRCHGNFRGNAIKHPYRTFDKVGLVKT